MKEVNVESFTTRPTVLTTLQGVTYATQSTDCSNYFNFYNKSQYDFYHLKDVEHSLLGSPRELLLQLFPTFANMNSFDTEQAVFLAFKIFLIEIYNSRFFSSENYHVTWQFNAKTTRSAFDIYVKNLYEFQQFMKEKQFDCGEANWDTESVTNDNHRRLQECVNDMKINHGWKVPPGRSLRITPSCPLKSQHHATVRLKARRFATRSMGHYLVLRDCR